MLKSSALIYFVKERLEDLKARLIESETSDYSTRVWDREDNRRKVTSSFGRLAELQRKHHFGVLVVVWLTSQEISVPMPTDSGSPPSTFSHGSAHGMA